MQPTTSVDEQAAPPRSADRCPLCDQAQLRPGEPLCDGCGRDLAVQLRRRRQAALRLGFAA